MFPQFPARGRACARCAAPVTARVLSPVLPIQRAVLHGFGDVPGGDLLRALQVGDGAGDLQDAGVGAVGQAQPLAGEQQQLLRVGRHGAGGVQVPGAELGVDADARRVAGVARALHRSGRLHPAAHLGGGLLRRVLGEALGGNGLHLDVHVDAVQQRVGDAVQIAADLRGRAAAGPGAAAQVSAGLCCAY